MAEPMKRADGRWELKETINGTRKSFYGKSKKETKTKRDEYIAHLASQVINKRIGFSSWSIKWLETIKINEVQFSTYKAYKNFVINYLNQYFKEAPISDIKPIQIQSFFAANSKLSSSVKDKLLKTLKQIFECAIDNDLCIKNPASKIKLGEYVRVNDKQYYKSEEVKQILSFAFHHKYGLSIYILLKTGLRRSELLALTWNDIDLNKQRIYVNKAYVENGGNKLTSTKSKAGTRVIPFDNELKRYLLMHQGEGIVIPNALGGHMTPTNWKSRQYDVCMKEMNSAIGLPMLSPHELRHTYGTLLRENAVDIYTIQKVMGHSDISVTAENYIHNDIDILAKALNFDDNFDDISCQKPPENTG